MEPLSALHMLQMGQQAYEARLLALLAECCAPAVQGLGEAGLRQRIQVLTQQAAAWGLADEYSAATYVVTAFQLGEGFDRRIPGITQVLSSTLAPQAKAQALSDFAVALFGQMALAEAQATPTHPHRPRGTGA